MNFNVIYQKSELGVTSFISCKTIILNIHVKISGVYWKQLILPISTGDTGQKKRVYPKKIQHTPISHTPGNPPGQLWKESHYSRFIKVARGVFERCVETTLESTAFYTSCGWWLPSQLGDRWHIDISPVYHRIRRISDLEKSDSPGKSMKIHHFSPINKHLPEPWNWQLAPEN